MLEFWELVVLFVTGLVAGFVDSIAGGGGLITLPVLLSFIPDPRFALGTNKLQATFGSASASWHYAQAKAVHFGDCRRIFACTIVGAAFGTLAVQLLDPQILKRGLPIVLICVIIYVLVKPQLGTGDIKPRMSRLPFDIIFGLALGFYDGLVGPGTGTFWMMAFMLGLGFNMTRATAYSKVVNFASNVTSLAFFLLNSRVYFVAGFAMGAGQFLGARVGSRMVVSRGTRFVRPIFIIMALAVTVKLLYDNYRK